MFNEFTTLKGKKRRVKSYAYGKLSTLEKIEDIQINPELLNYYFFEHLDPVSNKYVYSYLAIVSVLEHGKSVNYFFDFSGKKFNEEVNKIVNVW